MNMREFSRSNTAKLLFLGLCAIAIKFRNISTEPVYNNAPWFQQNLKPNEIEAMLNGNLARIDQTYKGTYTGDNNDGLTGLMYQIKCGYPDNARVFIRRGASMDMHAKNTLQMRDPASATRQENENERYYHATALHIVLMNANDDTAYQLAKDMIKGIKRDDGSIAKSNVQEKNGVGFTPLHTVAASVEADESATNTNPLPLDTSNLIGNTPYRNRRIEFIRLLMNAVGNEDQQRAYLNAQNDEGNTVLHILAQRNALETIQWLISTYGRMLKLDIRNKPVVANNVGKNQYPNGMTPADLARESGWGVACAGRLDVELERYNNKSISEEDYKNNPKFNSIVPPTAIYNSATGPAGQRYLL